MKKHIATMAMAIGLGVTAYGQGTIIFGNFNNTNGGAGLVYTNNIGHVGKLADNVGFTVLAGPDPSTLSPIATFQAVSSGGTWWDYGQFSDPNLTTRAISTIPLNSTGWFEIQMWYDPTGRYNTFNDAVVNLDLVGVVLFQNNTGGGSTGPTTFTGMPALILGMPEPSAPALMSLGAAVVFIFRRRRE